LCKNKTKISKSLNNSKCNLTESKSKLKTNKHKQKCLKKSNI